MTRVTKIQEMAFNLGSIVDGKTTKLKDAAMAVQSPVHLKHMQMAGEAGYLQTSSDWILTMNLIGFFQGR